VCHVPSRSASDITASKASGQKINLAATGIQSWMRRTNPGAKVKIGRNTSATLGVLQKNYDPECQMLWHQLRHSSFKDEH
jgi:hypothetical protein